MKRIKFITTTLLCLFLLMSIAEQVEASKFSNNMEYNAPAWIKKSIDCTLSDGTRGTMGNCYIAEYGECKLPNVRKCKAVD